MRTQQQDKEHKYAFDSLRELEGWISDTKRTWRYNVSRDETPMRSWDLNAGYDEALRMARQGWIDGAQRTQAKLAALNLKQPSPRERNDFYGFRPHVPRYCAGAPDCMIRRANDTGGGQSLVLYVNVGANSAQEAECMANYGVAIAQYIKQLELEGTRCEVHVISKALVKGHYATVTCKIKSAGQPLDLAVMAFAVGHPAMLRRIVFAVRERSTCPASIGYGASQSCAPSDPIDAPASAVVVNGMTQANAVAQTPEEAFHYLKSEIERIQGKQKEG